MAESQSCKYPQAVLCAARGSHGITNIGHMMRCDYSDMALTIECWVCRRVLKWRYVQDNCVGK